MNFSDRQRSLMSGVLPSRTNGVSFYLSQINENSNVDQNEFMSGDIRVKNIDLIEQVFKYTKDGRLMQDGVHYPGEEDYDHPGGNAGTAGGDTGGGGGGTQPSCNPETRIEFTTEFMGVGEVQPLSVHNAVSGVTYQWEVSGGGTLVGTGISVLYVAPDSNPDCILEPRIKLSCNGTVYDVLGITINAINPPVAAGYVCVDLGPGAYGYTWSQVTTVYCSSYRTVGNPILIPTGCVGSGICSGSQETGTPFCCDHTGKWLYGTTITMKEAGCCPVLGC
jgi:hypothetical protein